MTASTCRPLIGEVFLDLGFIDRAKLAIGLSAKRQGERLGEALVRLGLIDKVQLRRALLEQYRRWLAGAVGLTMIALQGGPAAAASSATTSLHLRLTIPARASVSLVDTPADLVLSGAGRGIARIAEESSGGSSYAILVDSESARRHGRPMLMGSDGAAVPYSLVRGTETLRFEGGRALLGKQRRTGGSPTELQIALPPGARLADTRYADTLRLVVRAN